MNFMHEQRSTSQLQKWQRNQQIHVFSITYYSVRKVSELFLQKPGGFQWGARPWGDLEPLYACLNFSPPVNSISWWQAAFEWGSVQCSCRIFIVRKMKDSELYSYTQGLQNMLDLTNSDPEFMNIIITGNESWV